MILGIGVDLLSLARLRGVVARRGADRLAARILSAEEREEWEKKREDSKWKECKKEEMYLATR
jgi:phosphopantetheinyl transferase (holo-ACP synthase)